MLYQLKNEYAIKRFPGWWNTGTEIVTNSQAENLAIESGEWFPLEIDEEPEYDQDTQYVSYKYIQEEDCIRKVWEINDKPDDVDAEMIKERLMGIL